MAPYVRKASHARSWYTDQARDLEQQLSSWLGEARAACADAADGASAGATADASAAAAASAARVRCAGVVAPHAGYAYSGSTAAWAYKHLDATKVSRIFVLGPSHHVYLDKCALTEATHYATPLGDMEVDAEAGAALRAQAPELFETMSRKTDEDEHSIEMHLPYLAHVMAGRAFKVVPILVGSASPEVEAALGRLLAPLLRDEANFFVASSDFCHWGARFRFQRYDGADGEIHESIEKLDRRGMAIIESQDVEGFTAYLRETKNTICGRHPIGAMLNAVSLCPLDFSVSFVRYAQSEHCKKMDDSSVSYASAVFQVPLA